MKKTLIIVPINEFSVAKSRLRKSFSQDAINKLVVKLSSQLLDRVETLLVEFKSIYDLAILTECNKVKSLYKSRNILYISPQKKGYSIRKDFFCRKMGS